MPCPDPCKSKIPSGQLKYPITIETRVQEPPAGNSPDHSIDITTFMTVKAKIETKQGVEAFDGTNLNTLMTHEFTIRYITGVTIVNNVNYNNKYFKIERIINLNEENKYLIIQCTERGDNTKPVNYS